MLNPQHLLLHVACHMIYVLVVFMQASGGAAGGKQGSSIANALDDSTPQQVGGSSKGYGCHMMAPNWSGPVQFLPWALCQQCSPSNASAQCILLSGHMHAAMQFNLGEYKGRVLSLSLVPRHRHALVVCQ